MPIFQHARKIINRVLGWSKDLGPTEWAGSLSAVFYLEITYEIIVTCYAWCVAFSLNLIPILMILFVLTIKILLGVLTSSIAGKKGYNRFGFFWYGFFYFPIAVGVAILAPPLNNVVRGKSGKYQQNEDELAKYKEMYEAGTLSWTQYCQKKEEIERREYYN